MSNENSVDILHVDDEFDFAELTSQVLERDNSTFTVFTETEGEAGLTVLEDRSIDCIVSDYDMPEMDGIEFLEAVRERCGTVPFILFTGEGSEEIAAEAIDAGVDAYLRKGGSSERFAVLANHIRSQVEQNRERARADRLEAEYELIAETATDMFFKVDVATGNQILSDGVRQFGYDPDEIDPTLEWWYGRLHPEDRERIRAHDDALLAREETAFEELFEDRGYFSNEFRWQRADGTYADCRERGALIFEDGEPVKMIGTMTDITQRKERERQLHQSKERYQRLLETSPSPIFIYNIDAELVYANDAAVSFLGASVREEVLGTTAGEFTHPDDRTSVESRRRRLVEKREPVSPQELKIVDRTDEEKYAILASAPVTYEGEPAIQTVATDITSQKQYEHELQQVKARYQTLAENIPNGAVSLFDDDLRFTMSAGQGVSEIDVKPADIVGKTLRDIVPPEQYEDLAPLYRATLDGECHAFDAQHYGRIHRIHLVPVDNEHVDEARGLVLSQDITEERLRERELERANDRLEEFANIVSHDIRNPLNLAIGRLELACEEVENRHLEHVETALKRMGELVQSIDSLVKYGEIDDRETVQLRELVEEAWEMEGTDPATLELLDPDSQITCSPSHTCQLLENLFRNAIDHAGNTATIEVGALDRASGFYVEDDGPGIPPVDREKIFEAGYSNGEGTGYGLLIVKEIATAHGWETEVTESTTGGARFEVATSSSFQASEAGDQTTR